MTIPAPLKSRHVSRKASLFTESESAYAPAARNGAAAPTVRKSWTLRIAPVISAGAMQSPTRQPVTESVFRHRVHDNGVTTGILRSTTE
jgi:hypothetical protein